MKRRRFLKYSIATSGLLLSGNTLWSKTYLSVSQAQKILMGKKSLTALNITLTEEQMDTIEDASDIRVRNSKIKAWRSSQGDWFILDQIIGKHENIDVAVGISKGGKVTGIEVLTYRESYGHQIRNARWRAQFHGKDHRQFLKLDKQIKNISGATLSCRHITDGINRLNHTWNLVLRHLK
ncbi:MAG: FMN-binding protein [Lentisphaeraceae bacterium]|nr:FMN-binding protein [Lentisphaeraceae bacterium]